MRFKIGKVLLTTATASTNTIILVLLSNVIQSFLSRDITQA